MLSLLELDQNSRDTGVPGLSRELAYNKITILPSLKEQQAIADFLDRKCRIIDSTIEKQKAVIEKLKLYKQSVIAEAVTKGLDTTVKMKPSGIEWIGDIPETWEVIRLRYLCKIFTGNKDTVNKNDEGLYPFYVRSPHIEKINTFSFEGEAVLMAGDGVGAVGFKTWGQGIREN